MVLESNLSSLHPESLFFECEDVSLEVVSLTGRGRACLATKALAPGDQVLVAPDGLKTRVPGKTPDEAEMRAYYSEVDKICAEVGSMYRTLIYWAALSSLTVDEMPLGRRSWPGVSASEQSRLLQLHQPPGISSTCQGRQPRPGSEGEAAQAKQEKWKDSDPLPHRLCSTICTEDTAVRVLCSHFELDMAPEKLERLVLAWKYNSFCNGTEGLQIFFAPALLNHSCQPNCFWERRPSDGSFCLFAGAAGLSQGEEATISYIGEDDLNGNSNDRRDCLANCWLFFCECSRCCTESSPHRPTCRTCSSDSFMSVVICEEEEELYPGLVVFCDDCKKEDLHGRHGFFFHCVNCDFDLCPACGSGATVHGESVIQFGDADDSRCAGCK
eukprot:TRINITY_DN32514_c0_g1_i1.p1 TRINITY_DN32514_c0_g1~~TRINITY_DN32514_c0_g1_i1.p1  ORF type:complete len:384 (+),score=63.04 TRINITY_DN32514_c0_g1_i1:32-1183(+)